MSRSKKHDKDDEEDQDHEDPEAENEEEEERVPKKKKPRSSKQAKRLRRREGDSDGDESGGSFVVADTEVQYASEDELARLDRLAEERRQRDRAKIQNKPFVRHESDEEDDDDTESYDDEAEGDSDDDDDEEEAESDSDAQEDSRRRRRSGKHASKNATSKRRKREDAVHKPKAASAKPSKSKVRSRPSATAVARIRASVQANRSDPASLKRRTEQMLSANADDATGAPMEKAGRVKPVAEKPATNTWSHCVAWLREQMKVRAKEKGLPPPAADAPLEWMDHDQLFLVDTAALGDRVPKAMPQVMMTKGSPSFIFNVGFSLVPLKTSGMLSGKEVEQTWDAIFRGGPSPLMLPLVTRTSTALLQTVPSDTPKGEKPPMAGIWWALQCLCVFGVVSRNPGGKGGDGAARILYEQLCEEPAWKDYIESLKSAPMLTPVKPWPKEPESCVKAWFKLISWTVRNIIDRNNRLSTRGVTVNFVPTQIMAAWTSTSSDELTRRTTHLGLKQRALAAKQLKTKGTAAAAEATGEAAGASTDWLADAWGEPEAVESGEAERPAPKAAPVPAEAPPVSKSDKATKPRAKGKGADSSGALNALAGHGDGQQRTLAEWTTQRQTSETPASKSKPSTAVANSPAKAKATQPEDSSALASQGAAAGPSIHENGTVHAPRAAHVDPSVVSWAQITAAMGDDGARWLRSRVDGNPSQHVEVPPALRRQVLVEYMVRKWGQQLAEYVVAAATAMAAVPRFLSENKAVSLDDIRRLLPELFAVAVSESTEKAAEPHANGDVSAWRSLTLPDELGSGASALDPEVDAAALRRVLMSSGVPAASLETGAAASSTGNA